MKKIKLYLKWFFGLILLIPIVVVVCFYIFKKDIEAYGINAINQEITVPFKVKSYDVTLWKTFPNFSFTLYDLEIEESTPIYKKPLATAKETRLVFHFWKVLRGKFQINKLEINGLTARVGLLKDRNNFDILTKSGGDTGSFKLENVKIYDSEVFYWDKPNHFKVNLGLNKLSSQLALNPSLNEFKIELFGKCKTLIKQSDTLIYDKKVSVDTRFVVNKNLTFDLLKIKLDQSKITGKGKILSINEKPNLQINFSTENLTIAQLLPWISSNSFDLEKYKSKGIITAKGNLNGPTDNLDGHINFELKEGSLTQTDFNVTLENISTTGEIQFGKTEQITVPKLTATLDEKPLELSFSLNNYSNPEIDFNAKGTLLLDKIGKLAGIEQTLEGLADIDVSYEGEIKQLTQSKTAPNWKGSGKIKLIDAGVFNKNQSKILSQLNGEFSVNSNILSISNLTGMVTQSPFAFSGEVFPIASYLFTESNSLSVNGDFMADHINYERINYIMLDEKASNKKTNAFAIPQDLQLNLKVKVDTFTQDKFKGNNLTGHILISKGLLKLEQIRLDFYEGNISGNLNVVQQANGNFIPRGYFICNHVAIEKLFYAFDNFSQSEITGEQLSGFLNANISIAGIWNNKLVCDFEQFFAQMEFTISQGRLKNYAPLKSLAKFVNVNELMDIQFNQLSQNCEIKNQWIYWSAMEIKNNAMNLSILSGKHSLSNEMDYRLKLNLNDLLANKYSLRKNRDLTQYTNTNDGGMNLFIHMYGNADNLNFKYDTKNTAETIVENAKQEKKVFTETLRKEFGLKLKDSVILKPKHVEVEWDE